MNLTSEVGIVPAANAAVPYEIEVCAQVDGERRHARFAVPGPVEVWLRLRDTADVHSDSLVVSIPFAAASLADEAVAVLDEAVATFNRALAAVREIAAQPCPEHEHEWAEGRFGRTGSTQTYCFECGIPKADA